MSTDCNKEIQSGLKVCVDQQVSSGFLLLEYLILKRFTNDVFGIAHTCTCIYSFVSISQRQGAERWIKFYSNGVS